MIATNQLKNLIGVKISGHPNFIEGIIHVIKKFPDTNWYALALGIFTMIFILFSRKVSKKIPGPLLAMAISAVLVFIFDLGSRGVETIAKIPQSLPPLSSFPLDMASFKAMFPAALAIAILGIVEALSIVKSIASKSGDKVNGNQEFVAQGLANITAGLTSGIPGSGSFTRSAVNFISGAKTRFSVVFSSLFILFVLLIAAPLARFIPTASLAGILMIIAYSLINKKDFVLSFKATRSDRSVLIVTMLAALFLELEQAVYIGVILSIMLFVRKVSHPQVFPVSPREKGGKLKEIEKGQTLCPQISIYQVEGSLFFGAINELEEKLSGYIKNGGGIVIVRLAQVQLIDATGVHALESLLREAKEKNITIFFSNIKPSVCEVLKKSGMRNQIGEENLFPHAHQAIEAAVRKIKQLGKCQHCSVHCFEECEK